jgi:hypothetical protein
MKFRYLSYPSFRSALRGWVLRWALVSFAALYCIGLLPHNHEVNAANGGKADCPICHAVAGLAGLTAVGGEPGGGLSPHVLPVVWVLAAMPLFHPRVNAPIFAARARAPPGAILLSP